MIFCVLVFISHSSIAAAIKSSCNRLPLLQGQTYNVGTVGSGAACITTTLLLQLHWGWWRRSALGAGLRGSVGAHLALLGLGVAVLALEVPPARDTHLPLLLAVSMVAR